MVIVLEKNRSIPQQLLEVVFFLLQASVHKFQSFFFLLGPLVFGVDNSLKYSCGGLMTCHHRSPTDPT